MIVVVVRGKKRKRSKNSNKGARLKRLRGEAIEAQKGRCIICGFMMRAAKHYPCPLAATAEHRKPRNAGGGITRENIAASHTMCNERRGGRYALEPTAEEREFMRRVCEEFFAAWREMKRAKKLANKEAPRYIEGADGESPAA